ncbi:hypothetical protein Bca4012_093497 [Brassica carinata]
MADVEDLLRTSPVSGSVLPEEVSSSQTAVPVSQMAVSPVAETVAPATRAAVPSVADSVDRTGSGIDPPSSPHGDNSGNDSGGEDSAADGPVEGNQEFTGSTLLTEDSLKLTHGKCRSLPSWASDRLNRILGSGKLSWGVLTVEHVRRSIPRITTVSRVVTSGPSLIAESSKRRGNASAGKKMGKVKRDIPVYTKVMSRTASALPSASLGGSGQSSALVPVTTPPAAPTVDSSVAAICSSPNKKVDGSD